MMKIKKVVNLLIVPFILLLFWQLVCFLGIIHELLLPSPKAVMLELVLLIFSKEFLINCFFTLYRTLMGFVVGCLVGIPLGVVMGYYDFVYDLFEPIIDLFRSVPATALFPLFLLLFGMGDISKIALCAWSAGLILAVSSMNGVHLNKKLRIDAGKTLKISKWGLFSKIVLPEAAPVIFSGMKIAISVSLIIVIVTEMFIGTSYGLGHKILDFQLVYETSKMYATIIITGLIGFSLNKILIILENKLIHWKGK